MFQKILKNVDSLITCPRVNLPIKAVITVSRERHVRIAVLTVMKLVSMLFSWKCLQNILIL